MKFLLNILLIFLTYSCIFGDLDLNQTVPYVEPIITNVNVDNDMITITGTNLHAIEDITLDDGQNNHGFDISSQGEGSIVAVAKINTELLLDTVYNLIISNALGQSQFTLTFQLQTGAIAASNLSQMGATDGQVLKWDNTSMTWIPSADVGAGAGGGTVTQVNLGTGLVGSGGNFTVTGSVIVDVGTTTGKIPQIGTVATGKTGIEISDSTNAALTLENGGQEFGMENNGTNLLLTDITGTSTLMSLTTAGVMAVTGNITSGGTSVCRQDGTNCAAHVPDDGTVTTAKLNTASVDTRYVNLSGDTLTGTLNLASNGLTVGTTQMVISSGDVGIGTGSPAENLHVVGTGDSRLRVDGSTSASLRMSDTGAGANSKNIDIINDGGDLIFRRIDDDFTSNAADNLVIKNDGKIGIGTSSPDDTFHLNVSTTDGFTFQSTVANTSGAEINFKHDRSGAILQSGDATGAIDFLGYDGAAYQNNAKITAEVDGTPGVGDMPGRLVFSTTPDGSSTLSERMRITQDGRVGIGTNNPEAGLDFRGITLVRSNTTSLTPANGFLAFQYNAPTGFGMIGTYSAGGSTILTFLTNNGGANMVEAMRITNTQRVGIGTASPAQTLDVNGNVAVGGSTVHTSDKRLKKDIRPLEKALEKTLKLRGVSFQWKDDKNRFPGKQLGLIAQEVKKIIPEVVQKNNKHYSVQYTSFVPLLIEAIKDLSEQNKRQNKKLQLLQKELCSHQDYDFCSQEN